MSKDPETAELKVEDRWIPVLLLSGAWSCAFSIFSSAVATLALAVSDTAPEGLQTLPLAMALTFQGAANLFLPIVKRFLGLKCAYILGAALGVLACGLLVLGCFLKHFGLQCLGACLLGWSLGTAQNYRFGAMRLAPSQPATAASLVLFGGVLGSLLGPGGLTQARNLLPAEFAGIYMLGGCIYVVSIVLLLFVHFPEPTGSQELLPPRPLLQVMRQPKCLTAVLSTASSYSIMLLLMAPTPVVMQQFYGHSYVATTLTMMGHMFSMFAPSPVTGKLINRFGSLKVIHAGLALAVACSVILWRTAALAGFVVAMALLGGAWNFMFIGGTVLLNSCLKANESSKAVAAADCCTFSTAAAFTVLSMPVVSSIGWSETQLVTMSMVVLVVLLLGLLTAASRAQTESSRV